jgi:hypothetical protein
METLALKQVLIKELYERINECNKERERLRTALRGLLPRGWRDGTMDHMPGVKAAREALE